MARLLFVASEAYPLVKTGGLADVAGSLPEVLRQKGMDVRLLLPAYADILSGLESAPRALAAITVAGDDVRILETVLPGTSLRTWLLDHPLFSARPGNPYHDAKGDPWPDNAERFLLLSRVAAALCEQPSPLDWLPDILHCNDWHTGLAVALVHQREQRPLTVFTIHSLAHMGIFDRPTFDRLQLPEHFWQEYGLEFYGQCSFIKGGLVYADFIVAVSPTYASEICYSPGGMGLEGLLESRREHLVGIINGIDNDTWNPATDPRLVHNYDVDSLQDKALNKADLQRQLGLQVRDDCPLLGFVGRLTQQKGLELLLPVLGQILASPAQLVMLGTGDRDYERRLRELAGETPDSMSVVLAYNEDMAHRIEAAADVFLMPSLFEPCGLNQLYSLRYGTLPVVRAVGGLVDTVVDADEHALAVNEATGFVFKEPTAADFLAAVQRAIGLWRDTDSWRRMQRTAMAQDFSWHSSADRYLELYSAGTK